MNLARGLDRRFVWMRKKAFFYRFAWMTRWLLFTAFLPTGMVKAMGHRFTLLGPETPIGAFFEAMYQTGLFWRFIGVTQMAAAILIVIPVLSHLGAAVFLPIILNIFIITVGLQFTGTPFITGPMLLAAMFLVFWDYHRFRGLLFSEPVDLRPEMPRHQLDKIEWLGFFLFAAGLSVTFMGTRSLLSTSAIPYTLGASTLGGFLALGRFLSQMKTRSLHARKAMS